MTREEALAAVETATGRAVTEATPIEDLELDSLEFLELLVQLDIPVERAAGIGTVADLVRAL